MTNYGVVIPAYNAAETIEEALDSLFFQSVKPVEVVVVDDGSSDNTADLARQFDPMVQVIQQKNRGPGNATSNGIRLIKSPLVATLDADDLWLENKIEVQLAALLANENLSGVFCKQRQFHHGSSDRKSGEVRCGVNRSSMLIKRSVFDRVGDIIDPPGNRGDMVDWLARVREAGFHFEELDEVLALRRVIEGSLSFGRDPKKDLGYLKVAHMAMLRRREKQKKEAGA